MAKRKPLPQELDFQPLGDRVLVRRLPKTGILDSHKLPDHAGTDMVQAEGEVIRTGPGRTDDEGYLQPIGVKPGDKVLFNARWNDFRHEELEGSDCDRKGPLERPLPAGHPRDIFLITEGDIAGILS